MIHQCKNKTKQKTCLYLSTPLHTTDSEMVENINGHTRELQIPTTCELIHVHLDLQVHSCTQILYDTNINKQTNKSTFPVIRNIIKSASYLDFGVDDVIGLTIV